MINRTMIRQLSDFERNLVTLMLQHGAAHARAHLSDVDECSGVKPLNDDGSIVEFLFSSYKHPHGGGQKLWPTEARYADADGKQVEILLFLDANDRLLQLERLKYEDPIEEWEPQLDTITLIG